ncbi:thrombospondin type 1 repeat-containing protein 2 precursor [Apostichopus japonicus]|uniref:Thrombospondin type 1 repeat-containing protein 2 n=1 Tax=Stichopus japonicus TaxID=307972 RepID=A0A2G8JVE0_STIJA|nr:thrombospondin type 1 repeat-containing protein 2 precursor [Apostichopus japonicus]
MPTKSIVCEDDDYDISCKVNQTIKITYASYGFQYNDSKARNQCDDFRNNWWRNLEGERCDPNSTMEASAVCNGLMACTISASNKMFTDTCQGVTKYLVVEYYCKEGNSDAGHRYGDDYIVVGDDDDDNDDDDNDDDDVDDDDDDNDDDDVDDPDDDVDDPDDDVVDDPDDDVDDPDDDDVDDPDDDVDDDPDDDNDDDPDDDDGDDDIDDDYDDSSGDRKAGQ